MTIDTATLTDLNNVDRLNAIVDHLKSIPLSQGAREHTLPAVIEAFQRDRLKKREKAKLKYAWPLHARDSQLPPDGDWDTWLITRRTRLRQNSHRCRVGPRSSGVHARQPTE